MAAGGGEVGSAPTAPGAVSRALAVPLAAALFAGLGFRLLPLGQAKAFWLDECYTLLRAHGSFAGTIKEVAGHDAHPPLYYLMADAWTDLFGDDGVRGLSLLAGILSILFVWLLARKLGGERAGLWGAALLAMSAFAISISLEARHHSILGLWVLLTTWILAGGLGTWKRRLAYGLTVAAGLYLHYHAFLVVGGQGLAWLVAKKREEKGSFALWLGPVVLAGVLFLPWGRVFLDRLALASGASVPPLDDAPYVIRLMGAIPELLVGPAVELGRWAAPVGLFLLLAVAEAILRRRQDPDEEQLPWRVALGTFLLFLVLPVKPHDLEPRHLSWLVPLLAVSAGVWISRGGFRDRAAGVIALAVGLVGACLFVGAPWEDWEGAARKVHRGTAGLVIVNPAYAREPFYRVYNAPCHEEPLPYPLGVTLRNGRVEIVYNGGEPVPEADLAHVEGLWIVELTSPVSRPFRNPESLLGWTDVREESWEFPGMRGDLRVRHVTPER